MDPFVPPPFSESPPLHAHPPLPPPLPVLPPPLPSPAASRRILLIQIGIVVLVAVLPDFLRSAASLFIDYSHRPVPTLFHGAIYIILRSLVVSSVTLGMMCWGPEPLAHFGLRPPRWIDSLWSVASVLGSWSLYYILAIGAWLGLAAGSVVIGRALPAESSYRFPPVGGDWDVLWLLVMSLANGFAEEFVMRAFLIPRFERLFNSPAAALLLTAAIFASYHAYQGLYGVVGAFAAGLVLGLIFLKTRSIWPVFLAHALMDALALLMVGADR